MGLTFSKVFGKLFGKKDVRILMVWPWPKFREICFEIWVGPAFTRLFSRFGRSGAQERKRPTFEKLARFVSRGGSMDPDAVPPDVASFSAGMTLTIGCKECPGA